MAKIHVTTPHSLSIDEATKRIKKLISDTRRKYKDLIESASEEWDGSKGEFMFSIKGNKVSGMIEVLKNEVVVDGEIPWALSFFKGKIESIIRENAKELLQ